MSAVNRKPRTVLVLDDDLAYLRMVERLLTLRGYRAIIAERPGEFFASLARSTPDLVMLDVNMPEMDGFEVYRRISHTHPNLPVLFVTGFPASFKAGCARVQEVWGTRVNEHQTGFLYKPYRMDDLWAKIGALLGDDVKPASTVA